MKNWAGILIALAVMPALGQRYVPDLKVSYDKFKDSTTVETTGDMWLTGSSFSGVQIKAVAGYEGQTKAMPRELELLFLSVSPKLRFENESTLIFLINGNERLKLPSKRLKVSYIGHDRYIEAMVTPLDLPSLKKLAHANTLEGQLGTFEFSVSQDYRGALGQLASYFDSVSQQNQN